MLRVLLVALLALPVLAVAASVPVQRLDPGTNLALRVSAARSSASGEISGRGNRLILTYSSEDDADLFVFPLREDGAPDAAATLLALLPAGIRQQADIDLTLSDAWMPGASRYRFHALSRAAAAPVLHEAALAHGSSWSAAIALRQVLRSEPFEPSSYHRLRGYRFLGWPLSAVLGFAALAAIIGAMGLRRRVAPALMLLILLLYGARVGVDLVRISLAHLGAWRTEGTYAQAGASFAVAGALAAEEGNAVFLCHDGSSYLPTLLSYLLYPRRVVADPDIAQHAIVMQKVRWGEGPDVLECGDHVIPARRIGSFPDGSVLYRILSS